MEKRRGRKKSGRQGERTEKPQKGGKRREECIAKRRQGAEAEKERNKGKRNNKGGATNRT